MINKIAVLFEKHQEDVLGCIAELFGLHREELEKLGGFESYVYQVKDLILKITHSIRRSKDYILGELEFVRFLAENGVSVAAPIPSKKGNLVETIPLEDGYFLVYAFQKAEGGEPDKNQLNADFYQKWGRLTGQVHALAKEFQPSHPSFKRQEWHEEEVLDYEKYVPDSQVKIQQKKRQLFERLFSLPKTTDDFGLTHNDIHCGNIRLSEGELTLFDFDDCTYHWFVNDIAIAVHSVLPGYDQEAQFGMITDQFLGHFMKGYKQENQLDPNWLTRLPDFLKLYDLINYGVFYQTWDMNNLSEVRKKTLYRVRNRIENEICIVDLDFGKYCRYF
jgi:Ser/Thr protein kinase RdoA (MazF antagonist)